MAIEVRSAKKPATKSASRDLAVNLRFGKGQVSARERMFFIERLALLLETGSSLHPSLQTLKAQTQNPVLAAVLYDMAEEVMSGKPFSQALARHPQVFSATYVNLVAAGEQGGFLPQVLNQLQQMEDKREKLQSTLLTAFSYPGFLLVFSLGVIVFILAVVFPKFGTLFASIYDQLPVTTRFLMAMSELVRHYWIAILGGTAVSLFGYVNWVKSPGGSEILSGLKLKVPGLKDIFIQVYLVQVLQVLSLSLGNGVSVLDALRACRDVIDNTVLDDPHR